MSRDERQLQVSLRLKAARYLAGDYSKDEKYASPISVEKLAKVPLLVANQIGANRLMEIEQMKTRARPMELQVIADALGVPRWFLVDGLGDPQNEILEELSRVRVLLEQQASSQATGQPVPRFPEPPSAPDHSEADDQSSAEDRPRKRTRRAEGKRPDAAE